MTKAHHVEELVRELYEAKNTARDEWADWLYENHVLVVADKARLLAQTYSVDEDLSVTAALLHDIADAEMSRFDSDHEQRSLEIARGFMEQAGYKSHVVDMVVDDAMQNLKAFAPAEQDTIQKLNKEYYYDIKKIQILSKVDGLSSENAASEGEPSTCTT